MHKELELQYIKQGDVFIAKEPLTFKTTLGSCVSICLWDDHKHIGGINHYTRPLCYRDYTPLSMCGEFAIKALIDEFLAKGSLKSNLRAGVFGGGNLLNIETGGLRVGPTNIVIAYNMLDAHGIQVIRSDTGHTHGLNVYFNTQDGTMRTEKVKNTFEGRKKSKAPSSFLQKVEEYREKFNNAFNGGGSDNT